MRGNRRCCTDAVWCYVALGCAPWPLRPRPCRAMCMWSCLTQWARVLDSEWPYGWWSSVRGVAAQGCAGLHRDAHSCTGRQPWPCTVLCSVMCAVCYAVTCSVLCVVCCVICSDVFCALYCSVSCAVLCTMTCPVLCSVLRRVLCCAL